MLAGPEPSFASEFPVGVRAAIFVAVPVVLGAGLGRAWRRWRGGELAGALSLVACLLVPAVAAMSIVVWRPLVGAWDALTLGALVGAGVAWQAHRALAPWQKTAFALATTFLGLCAIEIVAQLVGPAPSYPDVDPSLFLASAMHSDFASFGEELVCHIAYPDTYPLQIDFQGEALGPLAHQARAGASAHILHIGDSMVGTADHDETLISALGELEPSVEEIDSAWGGLGPDTYFAVLEQWNARQSLDGAVMYLFAGNDLSDLDHVFPCSGDTSLLSYDGGRARLRFSQPRMEPLPAGWAALSRHSPAPYPVRALVHVSAAAADLASALRPQTRPAVAESDATRVQHLGAILRSARDELGTRQVPLVVVVLPDREVIEGRRSSRVAEWMLQASRDLGIATLDGTVPVKDAAARGARLFKESPAMAFRDCHFNLDGIRLMSKWLDERLPAAFALARTGLQRPRP